MYGIVENFINQDDLKVIQEYIKTIDFNTKENHVPLHDELYEVREVGFDIHTRGEMPPHILDIFSKYSKGYYEKIQSLHEDKKYHPPMFSKHYIARYGVGSKLGPQYDPNKPEGTYKSFVFWNEDYEGGLVGVENCIEAFKPKAGTLIYFLESNDSRHFIREITSGSLYTSEAWMGLVGQAWMDGVDYEATNWDDWEIKGF